MFHMKIKVSVDFNFSWFTQKWKLCVKRDWNLIYDYDCQKKKSKYLKYGKANLFSTFVLKYDDKKEKQCDMYVWLNKSQTLKGKLVIMNSFF